MYIKNNKLGDDISGNVSCHIIDEESRKPDPAVSDLCKVEEGQKIVVIIKGTMKENAEDEEEYSEIKPFCQNGCQGEQQIIGQRGKGPAKEGIEGRNL